jgi:hypothetical protein
MEAFQQHRPQPYMMIVLFFGLALGRLPLVFDEAACCPY